jgi:hypothetical protein
MNDRDPPSSASRLRGRPQPGLYDAGEHRDLLGAQHQVGAERRLEVVGGHDRHALGVQAAPLHADAMHAMAERGA